MKKQTEKPSGAKQQTARQLIEAALARSVRSAITEAEARRRREIAVMGLREIELKQKRGELISLEEISVAIEKLIIATKNRLLALPIKMAPHLAAETDIFKCQYLLDGEIREALQSLHDEAVEQAKHAEVKGKKQ